MDYFKGCNNWIIPIYLVFCVKDEFVLEEHIKHFIDSTLKDYVKGAVNGHCYFEILPIIGYLLRGK